MEFMHELLVHVVDFSVLLFEFLGIIVILLATAKAVVDYVRHDKEMKIGLMEGMTTGLAFMIGGEIMRTITAHDPLDFAILACILGLRAAITILLNWEIRNEEKHNAEHNKEAK